MSAQNQNRTKMLETLKVSSFEYSDDSSAVVSEDLSTGVKSLSALEELSLKVELCLKKQQQVHFISKEIADIVKKSS